MPSNIDIYVAADLWTRWILIGLRRFPMASYVAREVGTAGVVGVARPSRNAGGTFPRTASLPWMRSTFADPES